MEQNHEHQHGHGHSHEIDLKKVERVSPTQVKLEVAFSAESVKKHFDQTTRQYAQQASLPGFRPGKAPTSMIKSKFREEIQKDVVSHLLEAGLAEACQKSKLDPLNRPRFNVLNPESIGEGQPLSFTVEFEIQPEIELRNYRGVPVKTPPTDVAAEDVDKTIEALRDRFAVMEPATNTKPEQGQFAAVEVSYVLIDDPSKTEPAQSFTVEIGKGLVFPDIEKTLPEMSVGEQRKVDSVFPEDYQEKDLAGKKVTFDIKLLDIKNKNLPAVDDAFAAKIRPEATVEALRADIEKNIRETKEEEAKNGQRDEIIEFLIRNNPFEVPKSLVDRQSVQMLNSMAERMRRQGQKIPNLDENFVTEIRTQAERRVRASMLLAEVATKEKLEADENRVLTRVEQIAGQIQKSVDETLRMLEAKEMMEDIRSEVLTDQVFDFLLENAQKLRS